MTQETITSVTDWLAEDVTRSRGHLASYFAHNQGRYFEVFSGRAGRDRFDTWDILAVTALSVTPPADAIETLLTDPAGTFTDLVRACRTELDGSATLEERYRTVIESERFGSLYEHVKELPGVGYVTASKLMASKFPDVIPIRDSRVEQLLGAGSAWWAPMLSTLLEVATRWPDVDAPDHPLGFDEASRPAAVPSLLRRLDVALWMEAGTRMNEG